MAEADPLRLIQGVELSNDCLEPLTYPMVRGQQMTSADRFSTLKALEPAWQRSQSTLSSMHRALSDLPDCLGVASIAVSGSLGRMEQLQQSDCDLIVLLQDDIGRDGPTANAAYSAVWDILEPLGLSRPRPRGIYATPSTQQQLCDTASLGQIDESPLVFGKRMQLLLDCQPVYGNFAFSQLVESIVARYARGHRESIIGRNWEYLIHDLIRYFRSLSVHYRWHALDQAERWRLRNLKLRYSRLILYTGLLCLLGESSVAAGDQVDWLSARLRLTPLERIASVYNRYEDHGLWQVLTGYDAFLQHLGNREFRESIADASTGRLDRHPVLIKLLDDSRHLVQELMRFVAARSSEWEAMFFESLFF